MALLSLGSLQWLTHNAIYTVIGIAGVGFTIAFHELGHFLFAKLFNISTPSFSIGMGPRLITKKIGETEFALSAVPLGGYVEIAGMAEMGQGDQNQANRADERSFRFKPYWQKLLVLLGGIIFNLGSAYFILSALFVVGMPKNPFLLISTQVEQLETDSPAVRAGLKPGDLITAIDGQATKNEPVKLINYIRQRPEQQITLTVERKGQQQEIPLILGSRTVGKKEYGYMGADFTMPSFGLLDGIKQGIKSTNTFIASVFSALKNIFIKRQMDGLGGPLMLITQTVQGAKLGLKFLLLLLAIISINLAVFNLIPLPILDGGQLLFFTIEAIIGRPLPEKMREYIHIASWLFILALVLFLTVKDFITLWIRK